jgi:hypothetical protein
MASPRPHSLQRHSLSSSSSSSSSASDAPDHVPPRALQASEHRQARAMDGRAAFSHSSPNLGHQLGRANSGSAASLDAASMHPPRTHSHGAVASHFLAQPNDAYGGQTWMDFLHDAGPDPRANDIPWPHAPAPLTVPPPNLHAPLPPLPVDRFPARPSPHYPFPTRSTAHTEERSSRSSSERKRRLTTADSPSRRPSSIRMHNEVQPGSNHNPGVLGPSPAASPSQRPSLHSHASTGRRDSDFVLPRWQPDAEVTHCFVCGSHFTFFYRKHHCRYVLLQRLDKCLSVVRYPRADNTYAGCTQTYVLVLHLFVCRFHLIY